MVRQVQPQAFWPSGDSVHLAQLPFSPESLQERYGMEFREEVDDLDRFWIAAIALPDGSQIWLERHQGDPAHRTLALVDAGSNLNWSLEQLLIALELAASDLVWVSPLVDNSGGEDLGHAIAMD